MRIWIAAILILIGGTALAQDEYSRYQVRPFDVEGGLPDEFVYDVLQDRAGYLWVATAKGIARYSGESYLTFEEELNLLDDGNDFPTHLLEAGPDEFYAGYFSGKIVRFSNDTLELIDSLDGDRIVALLQTDSGAVVLTQTGSLSLIGADSLHTFYPTGLDEVYSFHAISTSSGIWVATSDGLAQIEQDDWSKANFHWPGSMFSVLGLDSLHDQVGALNDRGELYLFNPNQTQTVKRFSNDTLMDLSLTDLWASPSGEWVLATARQGVFLLQENSGNELVVHVPEIPEARLYGTSCLTMDHHGFLWIGTKGRGLLQVIPRRQLLMSINSGNEGVEVDCMVQINDTLTVLGTNNGLYSVIYHPITRTYAVKQDSAFLFREILALDYRDGELAVGLSEGLVIKDPIQGNWIRTINLDELPVDLGVEMRELHTFLRLDKDNFLFSIQRKGIVFYHTQSNQTEHYHTPNGLMHNDIHRLFQDSKKRIWLLSREGGISFLSPDKKFRNLTQEGLVTARIATDVAEDKQGVVWLATAGHGVYRLDPQMKATNYTQDSGLYSDVCLSLTYSPQGRITVVQHEGIAQWQVDEPAMGWEKTDKRPGTEYVVSAAYSDLKEQEWLGTESGVVVVFSDYIYRNRGRDKFKLHLNHCRILGDQGSQLNLLGSKGTKPQSFEHFAKNLHFSFESPDFQPDAKVRYSFRLKGLTDEWSEQDRSTAASFSNLAPGNYTFELRSYQGHHVSGVVAFPFSIQLPFWEEWWYYLLEVSILVFLVAFALLSPKLVKSKRFVRLMAYIAIFMVFEYIHILLEPYIERDYVAAVPIFKLLAHLLLAIALFPLELILSRQLKKRGQQL